MRHIVAEVRHDSPHITSLCGQRIYSAIGTSGLTITYELANCETCRVRRYATEPVQAEKIIPAE